MTPDRTGHRRRRLRVRLEPDVHAPAAARRALRELPLGERVDDVLLLASELVTNAVVHGSEQPLELEADLDGGRLWVAVTGGAPLTGHGLQIVDAAAERWGVEHGGETRVWFELPMGRGGFEPPSVGL